MKNLFLLIVLLLSIAISAQEMSKKKNVFVRVYDLHGNKISKGIILSISDSTLVLNGKKESIKIPANTIGLIKTKHSGGNNVLVGAASGATILGIVGIATADPNAWFGYTAGEGAAAGVILGVIPGAVIGGITTVFKNAKSYKIGGDELKWAAFKKEISIQLNLQNELN
jgi:hypothetical protein